MNAKNLRDWLPVLSDPWRGEAICEAAGLSSHWRQLVLDPLVDRVPMWGEHVVAALCFGVLSVMADYDSGDGGAVRIERVADKCFLNGVSDRTADINAKGTDFSDAVLLSAYRWLGIEVDA